MQYTCLLLLLPAALLAQVADSPCEQNDCQENGYFPEGSCTPDFCQCEGGLGFLHSCPAGLIYNPELQVCDWPQNVPCQETTVATTATPTTTAAPATTAAPVTTTTAPTVLAATCDNMMKVYFDGVLQERDAAMYNWRKTSFLTIPAGTSVVAIECVDLGSAEGILVSSDSGLVTDESWLCSSSREAGWTMPGFTDPMAAFQPAQVLGWNGVKPWGIRPGIDTSAQWIWTEDRSLYAACRMQI